MYVCVGGVGGRGLGEICKNKNIVQSSSRIQINITVKRFFLRKKSLSVERCGS